MCVKAFVVLLAAGIAAAAAMSSAFGAEAACIAPLTYVALDGDTVGLDDRGVPALGTYERISPDGRFILRSYSGARLGKVSLIELPAAPGGKVHAYPTAFSNEAFPVQGTWRYLVDTSGVHYRFSDVLQHGRAAKPLFRAGMTGFYAAASEMAPPAAHGVAAESPSAQNPIFIRSLSWPQGTNPDNQGVGPLQMETVAVVDDGTAAHVVESTGAHFICTDRVSVDGDAFALPMISVDGTEFSAIPQAPREGEPSMRVYALSSAPMTDDRTCRLEVDLQRSASKAVFGFPGAADPAWLTYSDVGHVYVFDRSLGLNFRLDHGRHDVLASAFPGLTRDGRVVYGAAWRACADAAQCQREAGYVVADPLQSSAYRAYWQKLGRAPPRACITTADVARERKRFAAFHHIAD